jgi:hypothetical protein
LILSRKLRIFLGLVAALFILLLVSCINFLNINAHGTVLDLVSKKPIPGAKVRLDCRKFKFLHGSESIREVQTVADQGGVFSFNFRDTWDCGFIYVYPYKDSYTSTSSLYNADPVQFEITAVVPRYIWLVRESDVSRLRLEGFLNRSDSVRIAPIGPMPEVDYSTVNVPFFESIKIAKTTEEILWVKQHYCQRLKQLWEAIPGDAPNKDLSENRSDMVTYPDVVIYCKDKP